MRLDKQYSRSEAKASAKERAELAAQREARISAARDAIPGIDDAWVRAMSFHATSGTPQTILKQFNDEVRSVLDKTAITRNWSESDLPSSDTDNPFEERRGPMDDIQPWREAYFRLALVCILADMEARWNTPEGESFWKTIFPESWAKLVAETNGNLTPPLSPSIHHPIGNATAKTFQYCDKAEQFVLKRIRELFPDAHPESAKYEPEDDRFFSRYCLHLTGLSTYLSALRLNLCDKGVGLPDIIENLFDETVDPFKRLTRHRADSQLWPHRYRVKEGEEPNPDERSRTLRRVYADLRLRPHLRQALSYAPSAWQPTVLTLPMMDANCRAIGKEYVFNGLKRSDIELAVWCETIMTILDSLPESGAGAKPYFRKYDMNLIPGLPKYRHCLAEDLKRVNIERHEERLRRKITEPLENSRFAATESPPEDEIRAILAQPALQLNDDATLLPAWLTTPVLEGDDLYIDLEWTWIASRPADISWMELYLLALTGPITESKLSIIDYEQVEPDNPDADEPLHLRLGETKWRELRRHYGSMKLMTAFADALFCRMEGGLGTGVIVVGLVDLSEDSE